MFRSARDNVPCLKPWSTGGEQGKQAGAEARVIHLTQMMEVILRWLSVSVGRITESFISISEAPATAAGILTFSAGLVIYKPLLIICMT